MNWKMPARIVAAKRKPTPWSATRSTTTRAMAPVAAEIMPERPPAKAITIAIENDAYRPTWGATPAMIEKLIASGINASATTRPDRMSAFGFVVHEAMKSLIPPAGAGVGALVPVDDIGAFRCSSRAGGTALQARSPTDKGTDPYIGRPDIPHVAVVTPRRRYSRHMAILDDLAKELGKHTAMKVDQAVLLLSSDEGIPRAKMTGKGIRHHALFAGPAGLFFCDLHATTWGEIFSAVTSGEIEVDHYERLDAAAEEAITIERNFPSRKVLIDGEYYTLPRNFSKALVELLNRPKGKRRRR